MHCQNRRCAAERIHVCNSPALRPSSGYLPHRVVHVAPQHSLQCRGRAGKARVQTEPSGGSGDRSLHELTEWLMRQGSLGLTNAKCVQQRPGERGLVAARNLAKGELIFSIPLECAICDWPGDDDSTLPEGPGSVRLAIKLLRRFADAGLPVPGGDPADSGRPPCPPAPAQTQPQLQPRSGRAGTDGGSGPEPPHPQRRAAEESGRIAPEPPLPPSDADGGEPSSSSIATVSATATIAATAAAAAAQGAAGWGPYLCSLPTRPPAMLLTFTGAADLASLEYPPLERAILSYRALAAHHYRRCGGAAGLGGASQEQFSWALAIVGSRSLAVSLLLLALLAAGDDRGRPAGLGGHRGPRHHHHNQDTRGSQHIASPDTPITSGDSSSDTGLPVSGVLTPSPPAPPVKTEAAEAAEASQPSATSTTVPVVLMKLYQMAGLDWTPLPASPPTAAAALEPAEPQSHDAGGCASSDDGMRVTATSAVAAIAASGFNGGRNEQASAAAGGDDRRVGDGVAGGSGSSDPTGSRAAAGGQLRMLVPLLDMINHAGVRQTGRRTSDGRCTVANRLMVPEANVRWEVQPPHMSQQPVTVPSEAGHVGGVWPTGDSGGASASQHWSPLQSPAENSAGNRSGGGDDNTGNDGVQGDSGWRVLLVATTDLVAGQELLLCYDTTATNDAFALHYGFLPPCNPYDDVQLYASLTEALEWHRAEAQAAATADVTGGTAPHLAAFSVGELAVLYDGAAATAAAAVSTIGGDVTDLDAPVKLGPGGRVCPRLAAAFQHLAAAAVAASSSSSDECNGPAVHQQQVVAAVARRCEELLRARTPLRSDLAALERDDWLRRGHVGSGSGRRGSGRDEAGHTVEARVAQEKVEGVEPHWRALLRHYEEALSEQRQLEGLWVLESLMAPPQAAMVQGDSDRGRPVGHWPSQAAAAAAATVVPAERRCGAAGADDDDGYGDGGGGGGGGGGEVDVRVGGVAAPTVLTSTQRLALEYRAHKKMLLWDYLLEWQ